MKKLISFFILTWLSLFPYYSHGKDLNTIMMQATCKIEGPGSLGTGFIIGKPDPSNPPKAFYTLVTAAHILESIRGNTAVIHLRKRNDAGSWKKFKIQLQIRDNGNPLWKKHPEVDLAAIFVRLPVGSIETLLTTNFLITDEQLERYEIHPGLDISCLGYPFGAEANSYGFPILRSGKIASYPLTPTKEMKTFLFDFAVFKGNSGGPVYFSISNPRYGKTIHMGKTIGGILGIVVREKSITQRIEQLYEKKEKITPLALAEVIHASFIRELIDTLGSTELVPN